MSTKFVGNKFLFQQLQTKYKIKRLSTYITCTLFLRCLLWKQN